MVQDQMAKIGIKPLANIDEDNGCCYCLIEEDGERSFLSCHGAEYFFFRSWMKGMDIAESDSIYISGIDLEVPTGDEIVRFIYEHPDRSLYFSPGPRIMHIEHSRLAKIFQHRDKNNKGPLLHLNEREALWYTKKNNVKSAAAVLYMLTNNAVVITLGERGCYCFDQTTDKSGKFLPGYPAKIVDTTGAGDVHLGAVITGLKNGNSLEKSCEAANLIGAAACGMHGCVFTDHPDADRLRAEIFGAFGKPGL